jgi:Ca-activated chloride channel family protein
MYRLLLVLLLASVAALAEDGEFVFRSDVSLIRVDAQVVDRNNRAITGLQPEDFVLLEQGREQAIRNFAQEDTPVDVLLLLDVSGSMRSHIERIASAANRALLALGTNDRVGIMVFDRSTRLRLPLRTSRGDVERELQAVLHQETFDGGTDITGALYDAARYIGREARPDARRAIVILTDDQTERGRDENGVVRALTSATSVLSALLAPDAVGAVSIGGPLGGGWPQGPLGGIILGRRGPMGGRFPGPSRSHTQSAGTASIAQKSGGDSFRVDESSAFETTLSRLRQRYALHFHLPEGVRPGEEREIEVELSADARRRHPGAEVRFRRAYVAPGAATTSDTVVVSQTPTLKRRPGVSERSEPSGPRATATPAAPTAPAPQEGGWRRVDEAKPQGGWRRVKPGEEP